MIDWMMDRCLRNYRFLSDAVTDVTRTQWKFLSAQSQFSFSLWNALLGHSPSAEPPTEQPKETAAAKSASAPGSLEKVAAERLKSGLAPPREIYDVRNRGRIDWSSVPDWARPVDPEMFEGGHEG
jgi:hypothetical protein